MFVGLGQCVLQQAKQHFTIDLQRLLQTQMHSIPSCVLSIFILYAWFSICAAKSNKPL